MVKKVVVVDDDRHVVAVVRAMLNREGGFRVLAASDGREALALIRKELPTVVLLDLMLPSLDGASVAQELRNHPETARIPIVFLTGLVGRAEARRRGPQIGGSYVLAKPFDAEQLLEMIEMALPSN